MVVVKDFRKGFYDVIQNQVNKSVNPLTELTFQSFVCYNYIIDSVLPLGPSLD